MTATLTTSTTPAGPAIPPRTVAAIHRAMLDSISRFADDAELLDTISAARQPVSTAAVYRDLCEELGVPVPRFVRLALN